MPLPKAERNRLRWLAHNLVHRGGLSSRAAQKVMRETYGARRSLGQICNDLRDYECDHCRDRPARAFVKVPEGYHDLPEDARRGGAGDRPPATGEPEPGLSRRVTGRPGDIGPRCARLRR